MKIVSGAFEFIAEHWKFFLVVACGVSIWGALNLAKQAQYPGAAPKHTVPPTRTPAVALSPAPGPPAVVRSPQPAPPVVPAPISEPAETTLAPSLALASPTSGQAGGDLAVIGVNITLGTQAVAPGREQTVMVRSAPNAKVLLQVRYASSDLEPNATRLAATTDSNGLYRLTWTVPPRTPRGPVTVRVEISSTQGRGEGIATFSVI